jgi:hypothetical protein
MQPLGEPVVVGWAEGSQLTSERGSRTHLAKLQLTNFLPKTKTETE